MSTTFYVKTNGDDFLLVCNLGLKKGYVFSNYDYYKQTNLTFQELTDKELAELMMQCIFEECENLDLININNNDYLGQELDDNCYNYKEILAGARKN